MRNVEIVCNRSVAGVEFGASQSQLKANLLDAADTPATFRVNFDGELEWHLDGAIYRLRDDQFVEATFPDHGEQRYAPRIDGIAVLSVFDWLAGQPDVVNMARFRISQARGILEEEHHNVWGTNILKGRDGKYHAIYSRWPKSRSAKKTNSIRNQRRPLPKWPPLNWYAIFVATPVCTLRLGCYSPTPRHAAPPTIRCVG